MELIKRAEGLASDEKTILLSVRRDGMVGTCWERFGYALGTLWRHSWDASALLLKLTLYHKAHKLLIACLWWQQLCFRNQCSILFHCSEFKMGEI